ncbi:hypothetical protein BDR03DRAFT_968478 [Suillus americanus]|nr:hypothetical protein BDR03DRAFT_968478 [Suillus americanus]
MTLDLPSSPSPQYNEQDTAEAATRDSHLQGACRCQSRFVSGSKVPGPIILPSNLVFIQYLYILAIIDACHDLDPACKRIYKDRLKWPNDIYGLFPSSQNSPASNSKSTPEPRKKGRYWGLADIVIGSGLNVINTPPIASLAQLASTPTPRLCRTCSSSPHLL